MILMRAAPYLLIKMSLHKHLIYVLIRVPLTGLVNSICTFPKCHSSDTIILRYYYIPFMTNADQFIIHCICSCTYHNHLAVIRIQNMIRITQQCGGNIVFLCYCLDNVHYRTRIRIYKYLHFSSNPLSSVVTNWCSYFYKIS